MTRWFKPPLLAITFLCFVTTTFAANQTNKTWTVEPADMVIGDISDFSVFAQDFLISNTSDSPLRIEDVQVSCKLCLSTTLSDTTIPPGDVSLLSVSFNPLGYEGQVNQSVRLYTSDKRQPTVTIPVKANVVRLFEVTGGPIMFDDVLRTEERRWNLILKPIAPLKDRLTSARSDYDGIGADISEHKEPGQYLLRIWTIPPQSQEGVIRSRVFLSAGPEEEPVYAIPITTEVIPAFHVAPKRLVFDAADREQLRIVFIRQSIDPPPARLLDVEVPDERFRFEVYPDFDLPNYRINLYSVALAESSGEVGHLVLVTDRQDESRVLLPIQVRSRSTRVDTTQRASTGTTGDPSCQTKTAVQKPPQAVIADVFQDLGMAGPFGASDSATSHAIPAARP